MKPVKAKFDGINLLPLIKDESAVVDVFGNWTQHDTEFRMFAKVIKNELMYGERLTIGVLFFDREGVATSTVTAFDNVREAVDAIIRYCEICHIRIRKV